MAEVAFWEEKAISLFAISQRKERYLHLLKGHKNRKKFFELLNHNFEYEEKYAMVLKSNKIEVNYLTNLLKAKGAKSTCYLIADQNDKDGKELRLVFAINELLDSYWGSMVICPPKPLVAYKAEAASKIVLLEKCS